MERALERNPEISLRRRRGRHRNAFFDERLVEAAFWDIDSVTQLAIAELQDHRNDCYPVAFDQVGGDVCSGIRHDCDPHKNPPNLASGEGPVAIPYWATDRTL